MSFHPPTKRRNDNLSVLPGHAFDLGFGGEFGGGFQVEDGGRRFVPELVLLFLGAEVVAEELNRNGFGLVGDGADPVSEAFFTRVREDDERPTASSSVAKVGGHALAGVDAVGRFDVDVEDPALPDLGLGPPSADSRSRRRRTSGALVEYAKHGKMYSRAATSASNKHPRS